MTEIQANTQIIALQKELVSVLNEYRTREMIRHEVSFLRYLEVRAWNEHMDRSIAEIRMMRETEEMYG